MPTLKVRVEFQTDALNGTYGPSSVSETDAEGKYTLTYSLPDKSGLGAVVGKHKVVLQDLRLSETETGQSQGPGPEHRHHLALTGLPVTTSRARGDEVVERDGGEEAKGWKHMPLPAKYTKAATSGLTLTVSGRELTHDIVLK